MLKQIPLHELYAPLFIALLVFVAVASFIGVLAWRSPRGSRLRSILSWGLGIGVALALVDIIWESIH